MCRCRAYFAASWHGWVERNYATDYNNDFAAEAERSGEMNIIFLCIHKYARFGFLVPSGFIFQPSRSKCRYNNAATGQPFRAPSRHTLTRTKFNATIQFNDPNSVAHASTTTVRHVAGFNLCLRYDAHCMCMRLATGIREYMFVRIAMHTVYYM